MPFRSLPGAQRCYFQPEEHLISAGDPLESIYYLVSGVVYRVVITENGDESIISRKIGGEGVSSLIGILAAYTEPPCHSVHDFVAHTDCVCYKISRESCLDYLRAHPDLLERLLFEAVSDYTHLANKYWVKKEKNAPAVYCPRLNGQYKRAPGRKIFRFVQNGVA